MDIPSPESGTSLSDAVDYIVGEGGVRMYGVFVFGFLDSEGHEKVSYVPVDEPGIGQLIGALEMVKHRIVMQAYDPPE